MRAFLGDLDRWTILAAVVGGLAGALWLVNLPPAMALTGLVAPIGAFAFVMARRWLEAGVLVAAIGLVPTVAYRITGPPPLPDPLPIDSTPIEVMAPGGAYFLLLLGLAVVVVAAITQLRNGVRRQRQESRHQERRARTS